MWRRVSVVGIAIMTVAGSALAGDDKYFSGSACTFRDDDNSSQSRTGGAFKNTSTTTRSVICPIVLDTTATDVEYAGLTADATVDEDTCLLVTLPVNASGVSWWVHADVISAGGSKNWTRWFTDAAWGDTSANSSRYFECSLPANNKIYNYNHEDR
jgi:hypothetical protein